MLKYSNKFKLEIIKYYIKEYNNYSKYCKKFNIPIKTSILNLIYKYQLSRVSEIIKLLRTNYDENFKQNVIEYYNNKKIKIKLKRMLPVQFRKHSYLVA